jgi:hypothetical protein
MDKWATLNMARAVPVAVGAICTVLAALNKRDVVGFKEIALQGGANRMG